MPNKAKCVVAVNHPQVQQWMCGQNTQGRLAKFPIWEHIHVVDVLQNAQDVIASLENHAPDKLFISNRIAKDSEQLKVVLKKCHEHYPDVEIIFIISGDINSDPIQELIRFCLDNDITHNFAEALTASVIMKSVTQPMTKEQALALLKPVVQEEQAPVIAEQPEPKNDVEVPSSIVEHIPDAPQNEPVAIEPESVPNVQDTSISDIVIEPTTDNMVQQPSAPVIEQPKNPVKEPESKKYVAKEAPSVGSKITSIFDKTKNIIPLNKKKNKNVEQDVHDEEQQESILPNFSFVRKTEQPSVQMPFTDPSPTPTIHDTHMEPDHFAIPTQNPISQSSSITPQFINPKVVTFWSVKAIGKTTLLANMAVQAAKLGLKVIAIDMNVWTHDLGAYFGLPRKTPGLETLIEGPISEDRLRQLVHNKCGVDVLPISMSKNICGINLESWHIDQILALTTRRMDYTLVLVDISGTVGEEVTNAVLRRSDVVYVVVDQNKSFLEDIYNDFTQVVSSLEIPKEYCKLVINNFVARCDMTQRRIEDYFKMKAVATIPSDRYGHIQAVNYGKPYCVNKTEDTQIWNRLVAEAIGKEIGPKTSLLDKFKLWGK